MARAVALVLAVLLLSPRVARAGDAEEDAAEQTFSLARHRYTYAAGAVFLLTGLAAGYVAQGDTARAQTVPSAADTRSALMDARVASSTANVLYILAAVTIAYGVLFEFLPQSVTNKASLTFHF